MKEIFWKWSNSCGISRVWSIFVSNSHFNLDINSIPLKKLNRIWGNCCAERNTLWRGYYIICCIFEKWKFVRITKLPLFFLKKRCFLDEYINKSVSKRGRLLFIVNLIKHTSKIMQWMDILFPIFYFVSNQNNFDHTFSALN